MRPLPISRAKSSLLLLGLFSLYAQHVLGSQSAEAAPTELDLLGYDLQGLGLGGDIRDQFIGVKTCGQCETLLSTLKRLATIGDKRFVGFLQGICKTTHIMDADVCDGAIAREGPIVAHSLRKMDIGSKTSHLFCITFLGVCDYPDIAPYTVSFPSTKPPAAAAAARPAPSGQDPIRIVQFSDIHVDPFYVAGANANCSKPICCRPYGPSDEPGRAEAPAGPNGEHTCDAPLRLEQSMYAAVAAAAPDARFALFNGDVVDHAVWNTTRAQNTADMRAAYGRMRGLATPPLVFGTVGNHESDPTNAYPPRALVEKDGLEGDATAQWVYDELALDWAPLVGGAVKGSARRFGGYAAVYRGDKGALRVISVNTNLYYIHNYWLYEEPMETDPSGQLAWLVGELDDAERKGERVYIIGHTPMGHSDAFRDASNYFDQIVNRYSDTIAAMFFGHTHRDHFQITYSDYGNRSAANALVTSYVVPSLTPTSGMPAFRVYTVDPASFAVLDAETYAADMADPSFQTEPVWRRYYSAREAYGPLVARRAGAAGAGLEEELTPAFWHAVTEAFEADDDDGDDDEEFQAYFARKSRGWNVPPCGDECRRREICALRAARSQDNCHVPEVRTTGFGGGLGEMDRGECGVSVVRSVIGMLGSRLPRWEFADSGWDRELKN